MKQTEEAPIEETTEETAKDGTGVDTQPATGEGETVGEGEQTDLQE